MKSEKSGAYAMCFETLSNELRLRILALLAERRMSVQELAEKLGAERSRVSHSLEILRNCKYVDYEKKGKERVYGLANSMKNGVKTKGAKSMHIFDFVDRHVEEHCNECQKVKARQRN